MGSLGGHVIPAIFFLVYGIWWSIATVWVYLSDKYNLKNKGVYDKGNLMRKSYIPVPYLPRWPIEPVLKIIFPAMGIIMEVFFAAHWNKDHTHQRIVAGVWSMYKDDGSFAVLVKLHHITMHCCFIVSGIVDLCSLCINYPKRLTRLLLTLAFLVEFFVFYYHTQGDQDRSQVEVLLHELLLVSIGMCAVFTGLRLWRVKDELINGGLAIGLTLQGTWLIEIGVVVFGPNKWNDEHNNYMFLVACFVWHFMAILMGLLLMLSCTEYAVHCYVKRRRIYELLNNAEEKEKLQTIEINL